MPSADKPPSTSELDVAPAPPAAPAARRRVATIGDLLKKPRRQDVVTVPMLDEDNEVVELTVRMHAISSKDYDALVAQFPPTKSQRDKEGLIYDIDGFAPALISACAVEPRIPLEDATAIYRSDDWSSGEVAGLFIAAQRLCNAGLDVSFNAAG